MIVETKQEAREYSEQGYKFICFEKSKYPWRGKLACYQHSNRFGEYEVIAVPVDLLAKGELTKCIRFGLTYV